MSEHYKESLIESKSAKENLISPGLENCRFDLQFDDSTNSNLLLLRNVRHDTI